MTLSSRLIDDGALISTESNTCLNSNIFKKKNISILKVLIDTSKLYTDCQNSNEKEVNIFY